MRSRDRDRTRAVVRGGRARAVVGGGVASNIGSKRSREARHGDARGDGRGRRA